MVRSLPGLVMIAVTCVAIQPIDLAQKLNSTKVEAVGFHGPVAAEAAPGGLG